MLTIALWCWGRGCMLNIPTCKASFYFSGIMWQIMWLQFVKFSSTSILCYPYNGPAVCRVHVITCLDAVCRTALITHQWTRCLDCLVAYACSTRCTRSADLDLVDHKQLTYNCSFNKSFRSPFLNCWCMHLPSVPHHLCLIFSRFSVNTVCRKLTLLVVT